jgi:hypothetical protein
MASPISQDTFTQKALEVAVAAQQKTEAFKAYILSPEAAVNQQNALAAVADSPWEKGMHNLDSSFNQGINLINKDAEAAVKQLQADERYRQANPSSAAARELSALYDAAKDAEGNTQSFAAAGQGITDVAKNIYRDSADAPTLGKGANALWENFKALGGGVVEQIPNSIPTMGGMAIGGALGSLTGNPLGTAAGVYTGATFGNMASGQNELLQNMIQKEGVNIWDNQEAQQFINQNRDELLKENLIKSGVIGAVDTATIGLGGALLNAPLRTATENVLAKRMAPSDLLNPKLVSDVLAKPAIKAEIASDVNLLASQALMGKVKSAATGVGLEMGSEGLGEYSGQYAATGVADPKSAVLEGVSSLGQATGTHMAVRAMNGAKDTAVVAKDAVVDKLKTTKEEQQASTEEQAGTYAEVNKQSSDRIAAVAKSGDISGAADSNSPLTPEEAMTGLHQRVIDTNAPPKEGTTPYTPEKITEIHDEAIKSADELVAVAKKKVTDISKILSEEGLNTTITNLQGIKKTEEAAGNIERVAEADVVIKLKQDQLAALSDPSMTGYVTALKAKETSAQVNYDSLKSTLDQIHGEVNSEKSTNEAVDNLTHADPEVVTKAKNRVLSLAMSSRLTKAQAATALAMGQKDISMFSDVDTALLRMTLNKRNQGKDTNAVSNEIYDGSSKNMGMRQHWDAINDPTATPEEKTASKALFQKFVEGQAAKDEAIVAANVRRKKEGKDKITLIREKDSQVWKQYAPTDLIDGIEAQAVPGNYTVGDDTFQKTLATGISPYGRIQQEVHDLKSMLGHVTGKTAAPTTSAPPPIVPPTTTTTTTTNTKATTSNPPVVKSTDSVGTEGGATESINNTAKTPVGKEITVTLPANAKNKTNIALSNIATHIIGEEAKGKKSISAFITKQWRDHATKSSLDIVNSTVYSKDDVIFLNVNKEFDHKNITKSVNAGIEKGASFMTFDKDQRDKDAHNETTDPQAGEKRAAALLESKSYTETPQETIEGIKYSLWTAPGKTNSSTTGTTTNTQDPGNISTEEDTTFEEDNTTPDPDALNKMIAEEKAVTNNPEAVVTTRVPNEVDKLEEALYQRHAEEIRDLGDENDRTEQDIEKYEKALAALKIKHEAEIAEFPAKSSELSSLIAGREYNQTDEAKADKRIQDRTSETLIQKLGSTVLTKTRDVISSIKSIAALIKLNKGQDVTKEQNDAFKHFRDLKTDLSNTILAGFSAQGFTAKGGNIVNIKSTPTNERRDRSSDLINVEEDGTLSIDDNLASAFAASAYSYIVSLEGRIPTGDMANALVGRKEKNTPVALLRLFPEATSTQNAAANEIGQTVLKLLAIKENSATPDNISPELATSIGGRVIAALIKDKYLESFEISEMDIQLAQDSKYYKDLPPAQKTADQKKPHSFIKLAQGAPVNGKTRLSDKVSELIIYNRTSKQFISKLFDNEKEAEIIRTEAFNYVQDNNHIVPSRIRDDIAAENKVAYGVAATTSRAFMGFSDTNQELIAGNVALYSPSGTHPLVHADLMPGVEASQKGILDSINKLKGFMAGYPSLEDIAVFFSTEMYVQQRTGIVGQVFNPQSSKVIRWLMSHKSWETTIKLDGSDTLKMDVFEQFVAESLDLKTAAQLNEDLDNKYSKYQPAIDALVRLLEQGDNGTLTEEDQSIVVATVQEAKTDTHAFAGLMALAQRQFAQNNGDDSFTTTITSESDGKTNGAAIATNLLGAHLTVEESIEFNKQFGIYTLEDALTHFDDYKSKGGKDLYMNTAMQAVVRLTAAATKGIKLKITKYKTQHVLGKQVLITLRAIEHFIGKMKKENTNDPSDSLREVVKEPILMFFFGAGINTALVKTSSDFIITIKDVISKAYASRELENAETRASIITALNTIAALHPQHSGTYTPIPANTSALKLMGYIQKGENIIQDPSPIFNHGLETAIRATYEITIGKSITDSMKVTFEHFLEHTKKINTAVRIMGTIAANQYEKRVAASISKGTLEFVKDQTKGVTMEFSGTLDPNNISDTRRALEGLSNEEMDKILDGMILEGGLPMLPTASSDPDNIYTGMLLMEDTNIPDDNRNHDINVITGADKIQSKLYAAMVRRFGPMAVATISRMTHSFDSAVMYLAREKARKDGVVTLNLFDAAVGGIDGLPIMTKYLNEAFLELMISYSPTQALADTIERQIVWLSKQDLTTEELDSINDMVATESKKLGWTNLADMHRDLQAQAISVDRVKLEALNATGSANQYSRNGAEALVTDEYRESIEKKLSEINKPKDMAALNKATHKLGMSITPSTLIDTLQKATTFGEIHEELKAALSVEKEEAYKLKLLEQIVPLLPDNLEIYYLDPEVDGEAHTYKDDLGRFISDEDGQRIIIMTPKMGQTDSIAAVLLHELIHASIANTIDKSQQGITLGSDSLNIKARNAINSLERLRTSIEEANPGLVEQYGDFLAQPNAVTSKEAKFAMLQEFVAHGLTDTDFQKNVLNKIKGVISKRWEQFTNAVKHLLGLTDKDATGLRTFIDDISDLIDVAKETKEVYQANLNLPMKANATTNFSTTETFDALSSNTTDAAFETHLKSLLNSVVTKLHGPFGVIKSAIKSKKLDAAGVWKRNASENLTPLSKELVKSGLVTDSKQAFVMEQVYATIAAFGKGNELHTFQAYRDLRALYESVRTTLTPNEFYGSDFGTTSTKEAEHLYDSIFKVTLNAEGKSDYLARFAAVGLTNPGFHALLDKHVVNKTSKGKQSWAKKLQSIFEKILDAIHGWTSTHESSLSNHRLDTLISKLVDTELSYQAVLELQREAEASPIRDVESKLDKLANAAGKSVITGLDSHFVQHNRFVLVRAIAGLVKKHVSHKQQEFLSMMLTLLNDPKKGSKLGVVAGLINNVKGYDQWVELLRLGRDLLDKDRKTMIDSTTKNVLETFVNKGKNLTPAVKNAITAVVLKSNMSALLKGYSLQEMQNLLADPTKLEEHITAQSLELKNALTSSDATYNQMLTNAEGLGYYSATGEVKVKVLKRNVYQIIHSFGEANNKLTQTKIDEIEPMVSKLATLFTLRHTPEVDRAAVSEVMKIEAARPKEEVNGMEYALLMHAHLAHIELTNIYDSDPSKAPFGNIHEKYNPFTKIRVGDDKEGKRLRELGYEQVGELQRDPDDADQSPRHYYVQRDMKPPSQVGGVMQMGSNSSTEVRVTTGEQNLNTPEGLKEAEARAHIKSKRSSMKAATYAIAFNPNIAEAYMAPEYNSEGVITNWVYLMSENMKNSVLERRNSFDAVLGTLAGSLLGKQSTEEHNKEAMKALFDNFTASNAVDRQKMVEVGPKSEDAELRSIWYRLPEKTKAAALDIFGNEHIMVNNQTLDMVFGYRKVSMAAPFERANNERAHRLEAGQSDNIMDLKSINIIQKLVISFVEESLEMSAKARGKSPAEAKRYAKRAAMFVTRAEAGWQEIVSDMKDKIVVVSGTVLLGNIFSNVSRLMLEGIPLKNMAHYFSVAFKGATQYLNDKKHLDALLLKKELGRATKEGERQIIQLQDAIKRNPVTPLIEAGLLPTIVEDLDADAEFGFRTQLEKQFDIMSEGIPASALTALKAVLMTRESGAYKALAHITQLSDFVARYAMYQHQMNKTNPMVHIDAVARANSAFVQYSTPMQRTLQYSDDMGFTLFTKYFLYIQKELVRISKEQPGRVMTMLLFNQLVHLGPVITDSSLIHHAGYNPLRDGVFGYWDSLYKRMTIGLLV